MLARSSINDTRTGSCGRTDGCGRLGRKHRGAETQGAQRNHVLARVPADSPSAISASLRLSVSLLRSLFRWARTSLIHPGKNFFEKPLVALGRVATFRAPLPSGHRAERWAKCRTRAARKSF
jgi:hypothetical protein